MPQNRPLDQKVSRPRIRRTPPLHTSLFRRCAWRARERPPTETATRRSAQATPLRRGRPSASQLAAPTLATVAVTRPRPSRCVANRAPGGGFCTPAARRVRTPPRRCGGRHGCGGRPTARGSAGAAVVRVAARALGPRAARGRRLAAAAVAKAQLSPPAVGRRGRKFRLDTIPRRRMSLRCVVAACTGRSCGAVRPAAGARVAPHRRSAAACAHARTALRSPKKGEAAQTRLSATEARQERLSLPRCGGTPRRGRCCCPRGTRTGGSTAEM